MFAVEISLDHRNGLPENLIIESDSLADFVKNAILSVFNVDACLPVRALIFQK